MPISWSAASACRSSSAATTSATAVDPVEAEVADRVSGIGPSLPDHAARLARRRDERRTPTPPSRSGCSRAGSADGSARAACPATAHRSARTRVVLGGARPRRASRCCTSPSGRCRAARRPAARQGARRCGPSTSATRRWSSGRSANETYATALDDPDEALGRAYGTADRDRLRPRVVRHRAAEPAASRPRLRAGRRRARRRRAARRRRSRSPRCRPGAGTAGATRSGRLALPDAFAHTGLRAPFAFPDGTVADWVLTPDGWRGSVALRIRGRRAAGGDDGEPRRQRHRDQRSAGGTAPPRRGRATMVKSAAANASHPSPRASTMPRAARRLVGVAARLLAVIVERQRRHRHPVRRGCCCCARSSSRSVSRRGQLALEEARGPARFVAWSSSSRTRSTLARGVGDAGVEVGQLVGDVLGLLVEAATARRAPRARRRPSPSDVRRHEQRQQGVGLRPAATST